MLLGGSHITCMIYYYYMIYRYKDMLPGVDLYYTDPAQHMLTADNGR